MSFVNYAAREIQLKIVYYGPAVCGKTTNLQVIHRMIRDDAKGNLTSLATMQDRTLFFDFMPLVAEAVEGFQTRFQLYTVPGQVIYNNTRRLVLRGADGLVFVADSNWSKMQENVESLANLEENLQIQGSSLKTIPFVFQWNKRDVPNPVPVHYLEYALNNGEERHPSFESVACEGKGVFETLNMVARLVLQEFMRAQAGKDKAVSDKQLVIA